MNKIYAIALILFVVVFAVACSQTHTVSIQFETNGGNSISTAKVNSESPQYLPPIPQKLGYVFENWYIDQSLSTIYNNDYLIDNKEFTLYAKYLSVEQTDYVIITFTTTGGTYIPNQTIASGGVATKPENPTIEGQEFDKWTFYNLATGYYEDFDFTTVLTEHTQLDAVYIVTTDSKK